MARVVAGSPDASRSRVTGPWSSLRTRLRVSRSTRSRVAVEILAGSEASFDLASPKRLRPFDEFGDRGPRAVALADGGDRALELDVDDGLCRRDRLAALDEAVLDATPELVDVDEGDPGDVGGTRVDVPGDGEVDDAERSPAAAPLQCRDGRRVEDEPGRCRST